MFSQQSHIAEEKPANLHFGKLIVVVMAQTFIHQRIDAITLHTHAHSDSRQGTDVNEQENYFSTLKSFK